MTPHAKQSASHLPPTFRVLGVPVSATHPAQADACLHAWIAARERRYVCVFASDSILKCLDHTDMSQIAENAALVLPDGMPLVRIGRKRFANINRCYGPDLMARMCQEGVARGYRQFFYGGTADMLDALGKRLTERYPGIEIAGMLSPPFRALTETEEIDTVEAINAADPDIVWVGLGTLKQERWMAHFRPKLHASILVGVGAAFPFHAGLVPQAPRWMMHCGLEWLFRLCAEPRRLWRRYLIGNPRFLWLLLRQRLTRKPSNPAA